MAKRGNSSDTAAATVGYEWLLWQMADALRDIRLSKLISGELQVRNGAHIVWEATV